MGFFLIIETSTTICSISLTYKKLLLKNINFYQMNLLQIDIFIRKLLKICNIDFIFLDAIAFNNGPGSYTSIKIGLATARGISYAMNIPIIYFNMNSSIKNIHNNLRPMILIKDKCFQYNIFYIKNNKFVNINKYQLLRLIKKKLINLFLLYTRYDLYLELADIITFNNINYFIINAKNFINLVYFKYKKNLFFKEKLYIKYNYIQSKAGIAQ
ncbi:hypothetical protein ACT2CQ_00405 [Candidatus Karelsulcia muelleri]